jgi:hypothetical protein
MLEVFALLKSETSPSQPVDSQAICPNAASGTTALLEASQGFDFGGGPNCASRLRKP